MCSQLLPLSFCLSSGLQKSTPVRFSCALCKPTAVAAAAVALVSTVQSPSQTTDVQALGIAVNSVEFCCYYHNCETFASRTSERKAEHAFESRSEKKEKEDTRQEAN